MIWWRVKRLNGNPTPVAGEARAACEGVCLEGDCAHCSLLIAQVIQAIQGGDRGNLLPYGALISDCLRVARFFDVLLNGKGNVLAHSLAHLAISPSDFYDTPAGLTS